MKKYLALKNFYISEFMLIVLKKQSLYLYLNISIIFI